MGKKRCPRCTQTKPLSEFHPAVWTKSGVGVYCKPCSREYQADISRAAGVPKKKVPSVCDESGKECLDCLTVKPLDQFAPSERGRMGRQSYCKKCQSKRVTKDRKRHTNRVREWRLKNRAKHLIQHRAVQMRRRFNKAKLDSGRVTTAVIRELIGLEVCAYCGRKIPVGDRTIDHVVPLNRGGPHEPENLKMSCLSCNSSKSDKLLGEWDGFQGMCFS